MGCVWAQFRHHAFEICASMCVEHVREEEDCLKIAGCIWGGGIPPCDSACDTYSNQEECTANFLCKWVHKS